MGEPSGPPLRIGKDVSTRLTQHTWFRLPAEVSGRLNLKQGARPSNYPCQL
jgi:hypothetical protein